MHTHTVCGIALAVSLGGIAALLSSNVLTMLCIAGFVLLSSVTLGIGLRKRLPYRLLAVLVAFFALAALYLDTALPSLLAGKEPFAGIVELFYQLEDAYKQAGLDISSLQLSTEVLPEVFYGVLIALAEGVGFLTVVLAKWFSTKAKADVRPMAPFVRWQLPSSLRIGMQIIAAAIILMFILNYGGAETVMNTAFGLFMPLFAATGIASFIYIFSRNRPNQSVSPFAVVLMAFFAGSSSRFFRTAMIRGPWPSSRSTETTLLPSRSAFSNAARILSSTRIILSLNPV